MTEPINQLSNQLIHLLTVFWPHCYSAVNREKVMLIVQSFVPKHCVYSFSGTNHKLPHETFSIVTSVFLITVLSHAHYCNNMEPLVGICPCRRPTDSCMLVWLSNTPSFDARTVNMALLTKQINWLDIFSNDSYLMISAVIVLTDGFHLISISCPSSCSLSDAYQRHRHLSAPPVEGAQGKRWYSGILPVLQWNWQTRLEDC